MPITYSHQLISLRDFYALNQAFYIHGQLPSASDNKGYLLTPPWYQMVHNHTLTFSHIETCMHYIKEKSNSITQKNSLTPDSATAVALHFLSLQKPDFLHTLTAKEQKTILEIFKLAHRLERSENAFLFHFDLSALSIPERVSLFLYNHAYELKEPALLDTLFSEHQDLFKKRSMDHIGYLPWHTSPSFVPYLQYCMQNNMWDGMGQIDTALLQQHKDLFFEYWNQYGTFTNRMPFNITQLYVDYIQQHRPNRQTLLNLLDSSSDSRVFYNVVPPLLNHYSLLEFFDILIAREPLSDLHKSHVSTITQRLMTAPLEDIVTILALPNIGVTASGITFPNVDWSAQKAIEKCFLQKIETSTGQSYQTLIKKIKTALKAIGQSPARGLLKQMILQDIIPTQEIDLHM